MSADDRNVRILIADEQALFREAVRMILSTEADFDVVAEAGTGFNSVAEAERTRPTVAIVDSRLPGGGVSRTTREIRDRVPECKVLWLSGQDHQRGLLEAVEAGASGYVTKESALSELIEAVRAVVRGETIIPPLMLGSLLANLMGRRRDLDQAFERISRLTPREIQVLRLLVDGADNEGIGRALLISPQTARTHVQNVLAKLQVHSRLEAAAFVTQRGMLDQLGDEDSGSYRSDAETRRKWRATDIHAVLR